MTLGVFFIYMSSSNTDYRIDMFIKLSGGTSGMCGTYENGSLLRIYNNRIKDIENSMKSIDRLIKMDTEYINSHPECVSWDYLDKAFKLRKELLRIEHNLR